MSWMLAEDPDEWEYFNQMEILGNYPGTNVPFGSCASGRRQRAPEQVAHIKAERKRLEDDAILRRADTIRAERAKTPASLPDITDLS